MSNNKNTYSDTFKAEAVARIKQNDGNVSQTAKELGIAMQTLAGTDTYSPDIIALQAENQALKKQLKIAQEEREILKKAAVYFAKGQ